MAIVVADAWQGRGVGGVPVREAETRAREQEADRVVLVGGDHRAVAHAFYMHRGFRSIGRFIEKPFG